MEQATLSTQGVPVRRLILTGYTNADRRKAVVPIGASVTQKGITYPPDELVVQTLKHQFGDDLTLTPECQKWFDNVIAWRHRMLALQKGESEKGLTIPWADKLKDYQVTMVQYGREAKCFINADDRGLGKTLEALSVAEEVGAKTILVVAPGYLKLGWKRELQKWANRSAHVARGERSAREKVVAGFKLDAVRERSYLIVNYEMLRPNKNAGGYPELLTYPWDMVIYDEAHRLKGRQSQWTEGAKKLAKVPYKQFLTGNPIDASPDDIWQLLNLIDPMKFSSYWSFIEYFCNIVDNFFGKEIAGVNTARMAQLQYALQPYVLRRLKADVAPYLPDRLHHPIHVELEGSQKTFYTRLEKQMVIELENGDLELVPQLTAKQLRLQQAVANPAILGGKDDSVVERTCMDILVDVMNGADKCIVGTWFVPAADRLEEKIGKQYKVFRVRSEQKDVVRDSVVEAFKACKEKCVLVGTIRTMGEGLNIDECDYTIMCDKAWTPLPNEQFMDRTHRIDSTRPKHYFHIIVDGTVSEDKEEVLERRMADRDEIWAMREVAQKMIARVHRNS